MEEWEYRTIQMFLETWKRANEQYEDFVATFSDGVRLEGIETLLRRYLPTKTSPSLMPAYHFDCSIQLRERW